MDELKGKAKKEDEKEDAAIKQNIKELETKIDAELGKDKNNMWWCKGANVIDNRRRTLASKDDATD